MLGSESVGRSRSFVHAWSEWNDPEIGCVPHGELRDARGSLQIRSLGKGSSDATQLVVEGGEAWIVDYGASAASRRLAGVPLVAHGRLCTKNLAAMSGQHFDIDAFRLLEPRG